MSKDNTPLHNAIFSEKYRPQTFSDVIIDKKSLIENYLHSSATIPSFLFCSARPGTGKCLGKGTKVLMFDGTIKKVEEIKTGEHIMGWDSSKRKVLSTCSGNEELYKIIPNKGESWICNESHILSLVMSKKTGKYKQHEIVNMSVKDYFQQSKTFKISAKLFYKEFDFNTSFYKELKFDPYMIGLWLGDGAKDGAIIHHNEPELIKYYTKFAKYHNLIFKRIKEKSNCYKHTFNHGNCGGKVNLFSNELKKLVINDEKRIDKKYLINSKENRLMLLAGLIDSDGEANKHYGSIVTKYEGLKEDICFLARSLGFLVTWKKIQKSIKSINFTGEYYSILISGDLSNVPVKLKRKKFLPRKQIKNVLRTGFTLEAVKNNNKYYGFELDKDGMFLLWNGCVTHNTTTAKIIAKTLNCDILTLNASDERGVDTVRDKIKAFAESMSSLDGMKRCIFMDEADRATSIAQDALKNIIETYSDNCFFIFTCNDISKITEPIRSRCVLVNFDKPSKLEIKNRLKYICEQESITDLEDPDLDRLINLCYPDIRSMIVRLQNYKIDKQDLFTDNNVFIEFAAAIKAKNIPYLYSKVYSGQFNILEFNKWYFQQIFERLDIIGLDRASKLTELLADTEKNWNMGTNIDIIFLNNIIQIINLKLLG